MRRGSWEYADRRGVTGVVGIVAVTDEGKLLLVEQFRAPVNARVIELPAGLVGDEPGHEAESLLAAANRELNEETGYNAANMVLLTSGPSSAGMSNEIVTLCYATKLTRRNSGGGVGGEDIVVHEVPLAEITCRLRQWTHDGKLVDLKVYAAQHFAAIIGFQGS
jgi:ADP-ribose pyrophosphatase